MIIIFPHLFTCAIDSNRADGLIRAFPGPWSETTAGILVLVEIIHLPRRDHLALKAEHVQETLWCKFETCIARLVSATNTKPPGWKSGRLSFLFFMLPSVGGLVWLWRLPGWSGYSSYNVRNNHNEQ